jgi:rSAM/selenodomain-associated transferase 1
MINSESKQIMMVFAKAPIPGQVKTRLGKDLGDKNAAIIYKKMLYAYLKKITRIPDITIQLWCYPDTRHPFFLKCARDFDVKLMRQSGSDLGRRMFYAFRHNARRGSSIMILSGTDIPAIGAHDIKKSIRHLHNKSDVVLMPTLDGGYGLIAMKKSLPTVFNNMVWSTSKVLEHTLQRLKRRRLSVHLLAHRRDIDDRQDYRQYRRGR